MFTGIVRGLCEIVDIVDSPGRRRLVLALPAEQAWSEGLEHGASISVNGTCLTVVQFGPDGTGSGKVHAAFDCVQETLNRTNLGQLGRGSQVNVERALRYGDEIGGHHVSGHIDCVGQIDEIRETPNNREVFFRFPESEDCPAAMCTLVTQAKIAGSPGFVDLMRVDGISLTVVAVEPERFSVCLIPETLQRTTLGRKGQGDAVNLEFDGVAKVLVQNLERLLPGLLDRHMQTRPVSTS